MEVIPVDVPPITDHVRFNRRVGSSFRPRDIAIHRSYYNMYPPTGVIPEPGGQLYYAIPICKTAFIDMRNSFIEVVANLENISPASSTTGYVNDCLKNGAGDLLWNNWQVQIAGESCQDLSSNYNGLVSFMRRSLIKPRSWAGQSQKRLLATGQALTSSPSITLPAFGLTKLIQSGSSMIVAKDNIIGTVLEGNGLILLPSPFSFTSAGSTLNTILIGSYHAGTAYTFFNGFIYSASVTSGIAATYTVYISDDPYTSLVCSYNLNTNNGAFYGVTDGSNPPLNAFNMHISQGASPSNIYLNVVLMAIPHAVTSADMQVGNLMLATTASGVYISSYPIYQRMLLINNIITGSEIINTGAINQGTVVTSTGLSTVSPLITHSAPNYYYVSGTNLIQTDQLGNITHTAGGTTTFTSIRAQAGFPFIAGITSLLTFNRLTYNTNIPIVLTSDGTILFGDFVASDLIVVYTNAPAVEVWNIGGFPAAIVSTQLALPGAIGFRAMQPCTGRDYGSYAILYGTIFIEYVFNDSTYTTVTEQPPFGTSATLIDCNPYLSEWYIMLNSNVTILPVDGNDGASYSYTVPIEGVNQLVAVNGFDMPFTTKSSSIPINSICCDRLDATKVYACDSNFVYQAPLSSLTMTSIQAGAYNAVNSLIVPVSHLTFDNPSFVTSFASGGGRGDEMLYYLNHSINQIYDFNTVDGIQRWKGIDCESQMDILYNSTAEPRLLRCVNNGIQDTASAIFPETPFARQVTFYSWPASMVTTLEQYLPTGVPVNMQITRASDKLVLQSLSGSPSLKISQCNLWLRYVEPTKTALEEYNMVLAEHGISIRYLRAFAAPLSISAGTTNVIASGLMAGCRPDSIMIALATSDSLSGDYLSSPLSIGSQSYPVNMTSTNVIIPVFVQLYITWAGQQFPMIVINTNADSTAGLEANNYGSNQTRAYEMYAAMCEKGDSEDASPMLSYAAWSANYTLYCIDLRSGDSDEIGRHGTVSFERSGEQGSLSINGTLTQASAKNLTCIVLGLGTGQLFFNKTHNCQRFGF